MGFINSNLLPAKDATFSTSTTPSWANLSNAWAIDLDSASGFPTYPADAPALKVTSNTTDPVAVGPSRVVVSAGTQYVFYCPVRTHNYAGTSLTLSVIWYNAPTGGTTVGTAASITKSLTQQEGWWDANFYAVFGIAPAGATHAQISVSVSGLPARGWFWVDSVYFCEYDSIPGQLLSPNESSFETDTAGWTSTGSTLSRAAAFASNGYHCLQSTATGASIVLTSGTYQAVTPGAHLGGAVYLYAQDAATSVNVGIRWYDSSHTALSDSTVPVTVPVAGSSFTEYVFFGTAPSGAAYATVLLTYTGAVGNRLLADNVLLYVDSVEPAGNLLTYAQSTFEDALPAWTVAHGTMTQAPIQIPAIPSARSAQLVSDGSEQLISATQDALVPVVADQAYNFSALVGRHLTANENVPMAVRLVLDWYSNPTTLLQLGDSTPFTSLSSADTIHLWSLFYEQTAPAGATYARLRIEIDPTSSVLIDAWYMDSLSVTPDDPDLKVDVDNDEGVVTLQIKWPDDALHPRTGTLRVRRMEQDGSAHPIRTIWGESTALTFAQTGTPVVIEDYEAPLGQTIWYFCEWFDSSGNAKEQLMTGYVESPVLPDGDHVWMKSPGLPALNIQVIPETPPAWSRDARASEYPIVGRKNPVVITDVRAGRKASMTFLVFDTASHVQFDALLDSGLPVLFQAMPGLGVDGNHYFVLGDANAASINDDASIPGWRWMLDLTEIDRPSGGLMGSAEKTWQDIADGYDTWLELFDTVSTWADVLIS